MAKQHIILLPFMAQGHITPFLALANLIEERHPNTFTITIVNTPSNIGRIRSSFPPTTTLRFKSLPFHGPDHGLPPGAENSDSVPYPLMLNLFHASLSLRPHFDSFLSSLSAAGEHLSIVGDVFCGWSVEIAKKHRVFHATFSTCGALGSAAFFAMWVHLPHLNKREEEEEDKDDFGLPGFPPEFRLRRDQVVGPLKSATGEDPWSVLLGEQIRLSLGSNGLLCNTVEEMEKMGLEILRRNANPKVWPVGPLLLRGERRLGKTPGISVEECLRWLDGRPPASVVYVSFGSQSSISQQQMVALAGGLERSGHSFLWVVRPPLGFDLGEEFRQEWLPKGFEERMKEQGRGLLVRNWAPQPEILGHGAVGAFLTHCGWNSVLESLNHGVAMVGWPLAAEQLYNAKMLEEEMGVCVQVARGWVEEVDGRVVEEAVREVMEGERGKEMRRRAVEVGELLRAAVMVGDDGDDGTSRGSSIAAVEEFLGMVMASHTALRRVCAMDSIGNK